MQSHLGIQKGPLEADPHVDGPRYGGTDAVQENLAVRGQQLFCP